MQKENLGHYVGLEPLVSVELYQLREGFVCFFPNRKHRVFQKLKYELSVLFVHELRAEPLAKV